MPSCDGGMNDSKSMVFDNSELPDFVSWVPPNNKTHFVMNILYVQFSCYMTNALWEGNLTLVRLFFLLLIWPEMSLVQWHLTSIHWLGQSQRKISECGRLEEDLWGKVYYIEVGRVKFIPLSNFVVLSTTLEFFILEALTFVEENRDTLSMSMKELSWVGVSGKMFFPWKLIIICHS